MQAGELRHRLGELADKILEPAALDKPITEELSADAFCQWPGDSAAWRRSNPSALASDGVCVLSEITTIACAFVKVLDKICCWWHVYGGV
jgi:hypothetical protein